MSKIDKEELKSIFQGIKEGNKKSFEMLYWNYYSIVYGIAYSILRNRDNSEDVAHNVYAKLLKMDKELLPNKGEASWLYTVTKNEVMQFLRRQRSTVNIDDIYTLETENSEIEEFVDMESFQRLLEGLDPLDREIVSLKIISDFTFEKIGEMLDLPTGTVKWRYYQALHHVKISITRLATYIIVISHVEVTIWINRKFINWSGWIKYNDEVFKRSKKEETKPIVIPRSSGGEERTTINDVTVGYIMQGPDNKPVPKTSGGSTTAVVISLIFTTIAVAAVISALIFKGKKEIYKTNKSKKHRK